MKMKETTRTIKRYKSLEGQYVPRNDITDCFYMQENRSSRLQMFSEIGVLKNFAIFIGKTPALDSLFKKLLAFAWTPAILLKGDSITGVFLQIFRNF